MAELDRVSNSSFNKNTVKGARQELYIENADVVFRRHIKAVTKYSYLSPAIEAYNKLYNLDIGGNPNHPISVATESANTWDKGNEYFKKLIADIQGIPAVSGEGAELLSKIRGGYTLWQEDLSELFEVLDELKELREELKDSNAVSMQNYQMDKQIRVLVEKNRLYDEFHRQTAHQIDLLNDWLEKIISTDDVSEKRELLRRIVVVGAYLKRRNNLILVSEQEGIVKEEELSHSVNEMMKNLKLAGVNCACSVKFDSTLPCDVVMKLLDFYEYVVEKSFDGLETLLARFFSRDGDFYCCVDAVCSLKLTELQSDKISVNITDENLYTLSFMISGGEGNC
jgi:hypothetical protein